MGQDNAKNDILVLATNMKEVPDIVLQRLEEFNRKPDLWHECQMFHNTCIKVPRAAVNIEEEDIWDKDIYGKKKDNTAWTFIDTVNQVFESNQDNPATAIINHCLIIEPPENANPAEEICCPKERIRRVKSLKDETK